MNREFLIEKLRKYRSMYAEELVCKEHMISLLEKAENCFNRECRPGHFTASSLLVNKENQILLMHHTKLDFWMQLGGHCDGDADVLNVAIKEAQEESGIQDIVPVSKEIFDIDMHLIPQVKDDEPHFHFDVRFLLKANHSDIIKNHESKDMKWFSLQDKLPTGEHSVIRMIEKFKKTIKEEVI